MFKWKNVLEWILDLKLKTYIIRFLMSFGFGLLGVSALWAVPASENVAPDEPIYQRVKALGDYGLLDPRDKAVLDEGRVVTRLELAFYTEKAKSKLNKTKSTPALPPEAAPTVSAPVSSVVKPTSRPTTVPVFPAAPAFSAANRSALQQEVDDLLKELHQESEVLRTRLSMDDYRIREQADQLEKLKSVQDDIDAAFRKANKSSGSPNFNSISDIRVENVHLSGITQVSATRSVEEVNLGMWSDLGGKGAISLGMGGYVYPSNASAAPVSIYLFSPKINWNMDGQLGHWNANAAVEAYTADTYLGDFTRGNPLSYTRFEDPFDIKRYSTDKNMKTWDDFMTNLGYVPSAVSYNSQSSTGIVFDGLYMLGSNLPLVSSDAKAVILIGRMGKSNTSDSETHRWEEALKYSQPWANGLLQTSLSTLWVNENLGVAPPGTPAMDLRNYELEAGVNLDPFFLGLKGGLSHFYTGVDTTTATPAPLEAPAGQASLSFYPLTLYYTAISDTYANIQGTAYLAGFNLTRYGYPAAAPLADYGYGFVGMVDNLISDRHGWRANLGWKGRQQSWMKDWPSLLDDVVVNFDVAQNTEYRMIPDEAGNNVVEAYQLISVYYPDDTGLWGSNIWGGYSGARAVENLYNNNIAGLRNDGLTVGTGEFYGVPGIIYIERVPFILPVYSSPGVIQTSGGHNVYTVLDHLKTFNYVTLTTKFQFNKMLNIPEPFYGSFFFTKHQVSGVSTNPALASMPDPNQPGQTLANISNLFTQTAYDIAFLYQVVKNVNFLADYGWETWNSNYTYPLLDWRTDSVGAGIGYDLPWGGGKLEVRYKHLNYNDIGVPANSYQADQLYSYFLFQF